MTTAKTVSKSRPKRPFFGEKIQVNLNCSTLRNYHNKPISQAIAGLKAELVDMGGDPNEEPFLYQNYDWQLCLTRQLTAEERKQLKQWEKDAAEWDKQAAKTKIQKLAAAAGLEVTIE